MTTLLEFFQNITGIQLNLNNDIVLALVIVFGFLICYDVIHIVFSSLFGFVQKWLNKEILMKGVMRYSYNGCWSTYHGYG